jgi:predicted ATP-grasp superfamily ATP-dependent carboligase
MKNKVIILDTDGVTSLGLIRSFSRSSFTIYAINTKRKKGLGYYSKYITKRFYKKEGYSDESLLKFLTDNQEFTDAHIFPASDEMLIFLLKHSQELNKNNLSLPSANIPCHMLLDKDYIKGVAANAGFFVPRTYRFNQLDSVSFPVIVKPCDSLKFGKETFRIVHNKGELEEVLKDKTDNDYFIEDYIQNDDLSMYEFLLFRNSKKELSNICPIIKIRQSPPNIGSSSFIKTTSFTSLNGTIKKFLDSIDYVGLADIELKFCSERQKFFFIETNFRAGAPIHLSTISGLNLPLDFVLNKRKKKNFECRVNYWMNDQTDPANLFKQVSIISFTQDLFRTNLFAVFSFFDIKPFLILLMSKLSRKLSILPKTQRIKE